MVCKLPATVWRPVDETNAPHLLPFEVFPSIEAGMAAFPHIAREDWVEHESGEDPDFVLYQRESSAPGVPDGSSLALAYALAAERLHSDEGVVEVDPKAPISATDDGRGAYVQAWVYVEADSVQPEELAVARKQVAQQERIAIVNPAQPLIERALNILREDDEAFDSAEDALECLDTDVRDALEYAAPEPDWRAAFDAVASCTDQAIVEHARNDADQHIYSTVWPVVVEGVREALAAQGGCHAQG